MKPNIPKVRNMTSPSGNDVPNQFIIESDAYEVFQSYDSIIAVRSPRDRKVTLGRNWDYSNTTMKYLKQFLGHGADETRRRIESGKYHYDKDLA